MREPIPDEKLLAELQSLAWKLQRHPTTTDMDRYGAYAPQTYQDRFGSWYDSLQAVGIADLTEPPLTEPDLLTALRQSRAVDYDPDDHEPVGSDSTPPTHQEVREHGEYSPWLYIDRFESWLTALGKAGFDTTGRTIPRHATASDDELVVALHEIATAISRTPTAEEMDTFGDYPSQIYRERFGSWDNAVEYAELPSPEASRQTEYSEAELLDYLQELAAELGQTPTSQDMYEQGAYAPLTYQYRFGSWNAAVEAAGLEPNSTSEYRVTDDKLLEELNRLEAELESTPSRAEMNALGAYSATTYEVRFGSWNDAVQAAGLSPNNPH